MKLNRIGAGALLAVGLLLAACGTPTPAPAAPAATAKPAAKQVKVAVVMPSASNDGAFSQSMYDALKAVQASMGGEAAMKIAVSEGMVQVPNAVAAIRDYAQQGYDLVIAHGTQYGNSLTEIAKDFPNTAFAWGTATDTFAAAGVKNVFAYNPRAQEGGYVLGVLAAKMSKSGVIGVCGPVEAGDAKTYVDGFKKGVMDTKKDAKINVTYTGSFSDVSLMAAAAETHTKAGADILTGSSQSVVGAIGVAKDKKAIWFGTQANQTSLAPDTVGASQVYDWTGVIKEMLDLSAKGTKGGKAFELSLQSGGLKIVYNDKVSIPADAKAAADAAIKGIIDGTIKPLP
ncbi:MAG: BMP family protein [Thermoflexales bacterium]|nr:BMP family protein [Thermoflexales bacterium]